MAHHFTHGDFGRVFGEKIAAADAGTAIHPTLGFQREHDLFKKPFWHIIASREFADGNWLAAKMIYEREQSAQGVIRSL